MVVRIEAFVVMLLALGGVAIVAQSQPPPAEAPFKQVATIDALMHGQEVHLKTIEQLLADATTKDRLSLLHLEAAVLAELANVNILHRKAIDYRAWAADVRETSLDLSNEAARKNANEATMKLQVERIKATCTSCHEKYGEG